MNLIDGELANGIFTMASGFQLSTERTEAIGTVTLGVRPDDLVPTLIDGRGRDVAESEPAHAQVKLIEVLGPRAIVTIDARGAELTPAAGAEVMLATRGRRPPVRSADGSTCRFLIG